LAAVLDGMDREQAARIGGMDRQTLRDWVHCFNQQGPDGLRDIRSNWLSNRVFETYAEIVDAACDAWRRLVDRPEVITSIAMREWAHIGQR